MTEDDRRLMSVRELLELSKPLAELTPTLAQFPWDYETAGIVFTSDHLANVLRRFLNRELTSDQVEDWANAIEGREDVELDARNGPILEKCLFELANPSLTEALSEDRAMELLKGLR